MLSINVGLWGDDANETLVGKMGNPEAHIEGEKMLKYQGKTLFCILLYESNFYQTLRPVFLFSSFPLGAGCGSDVIGTFLF